MKRALIFLLISAILFTCSLVTAFATPAPIEESALLYMATNRPIDEGYELLAASVIESDGEFTCVETVYKNTSIDVSLLSHEPPLARICIRHTWYRNKVRICCVELFPTFNYTGTTASVVRGDLERNFEQYEAGYSYALGSLVSHDTTSSAKKASFEQTYYVYDSVGTVRAGVVRAYCTVTGECSGNTGEQIF